MNEKDFEILKLENQYCFPIYVLAREIVKAYRPLLDKLDITYPQYLVLLVLWEEDHQMVNQIGEKLHLDSGTLTPLLKRLEQKGLVVRRRKASDERVVEISLTENAIVFKEKACDVSRELRDKVNLTNEDLLHLQKIIKKIQI